LNIKPSFLDHVRNRLFYLRPEQQPFNAIFFDDILARIVVGDAFDKFGNNSLFFYT